MSKATDHKDCLEIMSNKNAQTIKKDEERRWR